MLKYRFLKDVDYAPTGNTYTVGEEDELEGWDTQHIENALKACLVEKVKGGKHGWTDSSKGLRSDASRTKA